MNPYESIRSFIHQRLSIKREQHSIEVAHLAGSLCKRYDIDESKGLVAGIAHDIAREFNPAIIMEYTLKDNEPVLPWENEHPILLHGRAGASLVREKWGIEDIEILQAIRCHTCGGPGLLLLSKILIAADYLEPGRGFLENREREQILSKEIEEMLVFVLENKFNDTRRKGREIPESSLLMYQELMQAITTRSIEESEKCGKKQEIR